MFDNYICLAGDDPSMARMVLKTASQLKMEYLQHVRNLDVKLENGQISDEQYEIIFNSLTRLYFKYQRELEERNTQQVDLNQFDITSVDMTDFEGLSNIIDEDLLQDKMFIEMFRFYNMREASDDDIIRFVDDYRKKFIVDEEKNEEVEPVERIGRRM